MQAPAITEIQTAIAVLKKLSERLNTDAAHSAIESPETPHGANSATRIKAQAIQQTTHIDTVAEQLKDWQDELLAQRRQCASHHV